MRKSHIWNTALCVLIVLCVAFLLMPATAKVRRTYGEAVCQSNLRRIAAALQQYAPDYDGRFPVNATLGQTPTPTAQVFLSDVGVDAEGNPIPIFQRGRAWIESLYSYLMAAGESTDRAWQTVLRCPSATNREYPMASQARVTYILNFCLCGQEQIALGNTRRLMMLRESDRLVHSVCRPLYTNCIGNQSYIPRSPFLSDVDDTMGQTVASLHAGGSYICFADGHVEFFTVDYFPIRGQITASRCWDNETAQWYNWGPNSGMDPKYIKSIAITPPPPH